MAPVRFLVPRFVSILKSLILFSVLFSFSTQAANERVPLGARSLVTYEQDFNDRVENLAEFDSILQNDLDPKYWPENHPIFKLDAVWVPRDEVQVISLLSKPLLEFERRSPRGEEVLFFIHPESKSFFDNFLETFSAEPSYWATPLASHRSVVAWRNGENQVYYLKISLNRNIGHALRLLNREQIERAAAISNLFRQVDKKKWEAAGIHFIDEPFHVILKKASAGYSLRANPTLGQEEGLIPLFSLYSSRNGPSLLSQQIQKSQMNAKDYLRTFILQPLISQSVLMAFEEGLISEPHEQNVLALTRNGRLTKEFYYRDAAGFSIDPHLRASLGKDMGFFPKEFSLSNLRMERADFVDNIFSYLLHSSFYAMQVAVVKEYPDITQEWVERTFIQILNFEVSQRTGFEASTRQDFESNLRKFIDRFRPGLCVRVFKLDL